jgi:hypothetical protein
VDDLPQLESLGNEATLTALREAKSNWTLISQTDLAMDHRPEAGASNGLSLVISLGRRLSMSPAKAWTSTILHRIRCAHFHQLYKVAIEDARKGEESSFFCLSDELLRRHGENPTRRHGKGFGWRETFASLTEDAGPEPIYKLAGEVSWIGFKRVKRGGGAGNCE